jgi:hypothetical protein
MCGTASRTSLPSVAKKMMADFEEVTSIIAHNPSKGRAREEIVGTFLERYLPARVRVG